MDKSVPLWPPLVCTSRGGCWFHARSWNRLHSVQACRPPYALTGRLLDGFLPLQQSAKSRLRCLTERVVARFLMTDREDPETLRCVRTTKRQVQKFSRDAGWVFPRLTFARLQITNAFLPLRAVGVNALPCPGGQVAHCGRQHSSPCHIAD